MAFRVFILLFVAFSLGCQTAPVEKPAESSLPITSGITTKVPQYEPLDVIERLQLAAAFDGIGFHQTAFNPCDIGLETNRCGKHYVAAINFQLLCRASSGTTNLVTHAELHPMSYGDVRWKLGGKNGYLRTDDQGRGQIRVVSTRSTKFKRLILISNGQTLGLRAGEVRKVVLPQEWCY